MAALQIADKVGFHRAELFFNKTDIPRVRRMAPAMPASLIMPQVVQGCGGRSCAMGSIGLPCYPFGYGLMSNGKSCASNRGRTGYYP
jgi:hypothetical protein